MPTIIDGTTGVSKIQDGAITADDFAAGAVVTSVNGQTGAVTISAEPTTAQVLAATAGASVGAVGTYAFLGRTTTGSITVGTTVSGSGLRYVSATLADVSGGYQTLNAGGGGGTPSGTWRAMFGTPVTNDGKVGVWLRIS